MNLLFWRHKKTGQIIHDLDYRNLRDEQKYNFEQTTSPATHTVEDEDDNGFPIFGTLASGFVDGILSPDSSIPDTSSPDTSFGGGDGGGGGADGNW